MSTRFSTARLARTSARHPWRVVGAWITILLLAGIIGSGIGDVLTTEGEFTNTPESVRAHDLIETRLRGAEPVTETIVIRSETSTVNEPAFRDVVEQTRDDLEAMTGLVESAVTYYQAEPIDPMAAAGMVSADRHATLISVTLRGELDDVHESADRFAGVVERHTTAEFTVLTVGDLSSHHEFTTIAESDLQTAEIVALPIALIVLVVVFGVLVAAGLLLILALVTIIVALGLTTLVGQFTDLSFFVINMVTMIGLTVGIDYALFIMARYREERRHGHDKLGAIEAVGDSASKAVLFSGITVALALSGMLFLPINIFRSLGTGAVLVVVVAVVAMLTLVPALLGLLGDVNWYLPAWLGWLPDLRVEPRAADGPMAPPEPTTRLRVAG